MGPEEIKNILQSIKDGYSIRKCAQKYNVSHTTVQRLKKEHNLLNIKQTAGKPRIISERSSRHIANLVTSGSAKTPMEALKVLNINASKWTARRSLRRLGLKAAEKKKKPHLSSINIKKRRAFAAAHEHWTDVDWQQVIWSDETKINRFSSDGRSWYWSKDPNVITQQSVKATVKHGGGNIMVWGCITRNGVGPLVRIDGIMNKEQYLSILQNNLPAAIEKSGLAVEKVIFQQDNDPKHTSKVVRNWVQNQKFSTMEWPPQSPDMNPIENFWNHIKRQLSNYESPPKGVNELWDRVQEIWYSIPADMVARYTGSMGSRIEALKKAKGLWTKY